MSVPVPLSGVADEALAEFARLAGAPAIAGLDGKTLLGERACLRGFAIPGLTAAGGFCRLLPAQGDWIALNLARPDDRALLPALFECEHFDFHNDDAVARQVRMCDAAGLVARGRGMGLAIAALHERHTALTDPCVTLAEGRPAPPRTRAHPIVLDLSALWAGPLAAHLLWQAGCNVIKVESRSRPDAMRQGQPDFFALLNQGKAGVALDLRENTGRATLLGLIADADIVLEAARPRALEQLGIDANQLVATHPGLIWLTITGHGATGDAAGWVGFGDDCGIAGGLGAAMLDATGRPGFVGDAIADPLTGIFAALAALTAWDAGQGGRWGLALRDVVASSLAQERERDPLAWRRNLRRWAANEGNPFPAVVRGQRDAPASC